MMNINVYRGNNQIGGNIIEISTASTRILLDAGLSLDDSENRELPAIEGLFDTPSFDAVFISHYHCDHLGLAYYIDKSIPLYIGEASCRIIRTADGYKNIETISPAGFMSHKVPITVGDITVTPFLCDHSAFDSYMILCESSGESVLYTGDFRSHGRKSFDWLLSQLPDNVDKLICEGTTLTRGSFTPVTETELEESTVREFRKYGGPIFVLLSSTNIYRIVTMYRAAKRSGRVFLEELYMAEVTSAIGGNIPNPSFGDVYAFITNNSRYETLTKYKNRIGKDRIAASNFVMCVRSSMLGYMKSLAELVPFGSGLLVYSMWNGYKKLPEVKAFLEGCENLGLELVDLHTSGHADPDTIKLLVNRTHPGEIIPVHTENPDWFDEKIRRE